MDAKFADTEGHLYLFLKNPCISRPAQFKLMLFKSQLYILLNHYHWTMTNSTVTHAWGSLYTWLFLRKAHHSFLRNSHLGTLSTVLRDNYKQWNHQQKKWKNVKNLALRRPQKRHIYSTSAEKRKQSINLFILIWERTCQMTQIFHCSVHVSEWLWQHCVDFGVTKSILSRRQICIYRIHKQWGSTVYQ